MDTKKSIIKLIKTLIYTVSMFIIFLGADTIPAVKANSDIVFYEDSIEKTKLMTDTAVIKGNILEIKTEQSVTEVVQTDIRIDTSTFKTVYNRGENVDVSGLIIYRQFSDNSEIKLGVDEYNISTVDTSTCGTKEIIVQSEIFTKSFEIYVTFTEEDIEDYKMYSSTSLNLRKGPGTEFEVLCSVGLNDEVLVLSKADNGWVKVLYNGSEYWCSASYIMKEPKIVVETPVIQNSSEYDTELLVFDGNVSKECKDKAISLFNKIPQNMKDAIKADNSNWVISSDSSWTDGNCGTYYPKQWYPNEANNICVYAKSVWAVDIAVIHEAGHWMDDYLGRKEGWGTTQYYGYNGVSSDENWVNIYNEEVEASGFPSWVNYCPEEYFAESTWKALVSPSWCKKTIPKTYDYIMSCVNRVE